MCRSDGKRIVVLVVAIGVMLVAGCNKPHDENNVIGDRTRLPEENSDLQAVLQQGDTLKFVYKHGSTKPTYAVGDIVVGAKGEGYLKKVASVATAGDTLVLLTTQAALTDAIVKCDVESTLTLVPASTRMASVVVDTFFLDKDGVRDRVLIHSDGPVVEPMPGGLEFEVRLPNVSIEISNQNGLAVHMSCDTLILEKTVSVDLGLSIRDGEIQSFKAIATSGDQVRFKGVSIGIEQSIVETEKQYKLATVHLGTATIMVPPLLLPIVFVFDLGVYAGLGADLTVSVSGEIQNDVSLSSTTTLGARYDSGAWQQVYDRSMDGSADFSFTPVEVAASLQGFLKGSLDAKIYGVAGPSLYLKPYLYDEVTVPPIKLEVGAGIAAGLGFKVEVLSHLLAEFDWTAADYRWAIAETTYDTTGGGSYPNRVVGTITVGSSPDGVTVLPNGSYIYVANGADGNASVIRTSDNTVVGTVPVGQEPSGTTALPNGSYVYVANYGSDDVSVIRASDNSVTATISVGGSPDDIAALPNGSFLYVVNASTNDVSVVRASDNSVTATLSVGAHPLGVAALPNGNYVYVTNTSSDDVSVIRTSDNSVVATVPVGRYPLNAATLPNGSYVYVTNKNDNTVSVIRTSDNTVVNTIPVGAGPCGVIALPNGSYVYVTTLDDNSVSVIRTSDNTVVGTIPVGTVPYAVTALPNGNYLYVTNGQDNSVSVIGY